MSFSNSQNHEDIMTLSNSSVIDGSVDSNDDFVVYVITVRNDQTHSTVPGNALKVKHIKSNKILKIGSFDSDIVSVSLQHSQSYGFFSSFF